MKKFMTYTFIAIGGYLVLSKATAFGRVLNAGEKAYVGGVKVLQGR